MKVRELIEELTRYEMDDEVDVLIKLNKSVEEESFTFDYNRVLEEVKFVVDLDGYDLVESDELDRLQDIEDDYVELRSNL